jgi:hypothetical protein
MVEFEMRRVSTHLNRKIITKSNKIQMNHKFIQILMIGLLINTVSCN